MTDAMILRTCEETTTALIAAGRPACEWNGDARAASGMELSRFFDHTLLKPDAQEHQYLQLCAEARELGTRSVCVPPDRVELCAAALQGSPVEVCTVVGFPLGYQSTSAKVADVEITTGCGATEFDMVIPLGRMRDGDINRVYDDVAAVVTAAGPRIVKVILEVFLLTPEQRVKAAAAAVHAGAAILKTSTGFAGGGATVEDLQMLRLVAGETRGVKAAGGIRDLEFTRGCIAAGADRIGASATVSILAQASAPDGTVIGGGGEGY